MGRFDRNTQNERAYKEEVARLCGERLSPDIFPREMTATAADEVVAATLGLLTKRLESTGEPQNLLGWRYLEFLRTMEGQERFRFARAFGDLLFGSGSSPERVERFTAVMWPIWQRLDANKPYALCRNFPTLFLMLFYPRQDISVRYDIFATAAKPLLGDWLLRNAPFGADHYRDVLAFSGAIFRELQAWGWRPRDYIDVYSFLWVVTRPDPLYDSGDDREGVPAGMVPGEDSERTTTDEVT